MSKFRIGDVIAFPYAPEGNLLDFFGLGIKTFQSFDDFYNKTPDLPIDPDDITHIGFVINSTQFIESTAMGVRIMPLEKLKGKEYWHCVLKYSYRQKILQKISLFDQFIQEETGKRYDFLQIPKYALYLASFGLWKPKNCSKYNVCSELCHRVMYLMGIPSKKENSATVTPSDIFAEDWYFERRHYNGAD
jgi:hypothetical protein